MHNLAFTADAKTAVIIVLIAFGAGLFGGIGIYTGITKKKK